MCGIGPMTARLESDGVNGAVHLGHAEKVLNLILGLTLRDVDGLTAERACMGQPFRHQIADDDHGGAEQLRRMGCRQTDRPGPGHVDGRARTHAGRDASVVAGRKDVREHGEVEDLLHGLLAVRKPQQGPICIGNHDVLGLPADPPAHVHVAVGSTGPLGVGVEADTGVPLLAHPTSPTCDVEGDGAEVTDGNEFDVPGPPRSLPL